MIASCNAAIRKPNQSDTPLAIRANGTAIINLHSHPVDDGWVGIGLRVRTDFGFDCHAQLTSRSSNWPNAGMFSPRY